MNQSGRMKSNHSKVTSRESEGKHATLGFFSPAEFGKFF